MGDEFEDLGDDAWWMHEQCMKNSELIEYFGGEKQLRKAREAADEADKKAQTPASSSKSKAEKSKKDKEPKADPNAAAKEKIKAMSIKELKAYLTKLQTPHD